MRGKKQSCIIIHNNKVIKLDNGDSVNKSERWNKWLLAVDPVRFVIPMEATEKIPNIAQIPANWFWA